MKKTLLILLPTVMLFSCSIIRSIRGSGDPRTGPSLDNQNVADNSRRKEDPSSDTILITGSYYIPIEGRSETGTRADLEGAWVLDSLNGSLVPGKSNINVEISTKQIPEGTEIRHDSTTSTQTINGVTHVTTSVLIDRMGTSGNKITPPQGANYHIPSKPSINFYGSNETFSGFTGCNKYTGRYTVKGKEVISLQSAAASTKMVCIGDYDEEAFLNTLRRVNGFKAVNGQLALLDGNNVVLVFSKKQQ